MVVGRGGSIDFSLWKWARHVLYVQTKLEPLLGTFPKSRVQWLTESVDLRAWRRSVLRLSALCSQLISSMIGEGEARECLGCGWGVDRELTASSLRCHTRLLQ